MLLPSLTPPPHKTIELTAVAGRKASRTRISAAQQRLIIRVTSSVWQSSVIDHYYCDVCQSWTVQLKCDPERSGRQETQFHAPCSATEARPSLPVRAMQTLEGKGRSVVIFVSVLSSSVQGDILSSPGPVDAKTHRSKHASNPQHHAEFQGQCLTTSSQRCWTKTMDLYFNRSP